MKEAPENPNKMQLEYKSNRTQTASGEYVINLAPLRDFEDEYAAKAKDRFKYYNELMPKGTNVYFDKTLKKVVIIEK